MIIIKKNLIKNPNVYFFSFFSFTMGDRYLAIIASKYKWEKEQKAKHAPLYPNGVGSLAIHFREAPMFYRRLISKFTFNVCDLFRIQQTNSF